MEEVKENIKTLAPGEYQASEVRSFFERIVVEYPYLKNLLNHPGWEEKIAKNACCACIKHEGEGLIAAAFYYCNDLESRSAYLPFIGVLNSKNKIRGVDLISVVEQDARNRGMIKMSLQCDFFNERALAFYLKNGYVEIGRNEQKISLCKELT